MLDILPKKCCVRYNPPTLVLFYELSERGKIHRRTIPIKEIQKTDGNILLQQLMKSHHGKYLENFKEEQIIRILNVLIEKNDGIKIEIPKHDSHNVSGINIQEEDLNKLDDDKLNEIKTHMNGSFEQHHVKPGDENWRYDVEVDFENDDPIVAGNIESAGWDEDSDMEF